MGPREKIRGAASGLSPVSTASRSVPPAEPPPGAAAAPPATATTASRRSASGSVQPPTAEPGGGGCCPPMRVTEEAVHFWPTTTGRPVRLTSCARRRRSFHAGHARKG